MFYLIDSRDDEIGSVRYATYGAARDAATRYLQQSNDSKVYIYKLSVENDSILFGSLTNYLSED